MHLTEGPAPSLPLSEAAAPVHTASTERSSRVAYEGKNPREKSKGQSSRSQGGGKKQSKRSQSSAGGGRGKSRAKSSQQANEVEDSMD